MKVVAITGFSGSGKTTLIVQLIARFVAEGKRVGAIKHTHHPLNEENRGDTSRFRAAGAEPVILARDDAPHPGPSGEAVIFHRDGTTRIRYDEPNDLLSHFTTDIVLVEGFRRHGPWPQIEIDANARPTVEELVTNLDRIWRP